MELLRLVDKELDNNHGYYQSQRTLWLIYGSVPSRLFIDRELILLSLQSTLPPLFRRVHYNLIYFHALLNSPLWRLSLQDTGCVKLWGRKNTGTVSKPRQISWSSNDLFQEGARQKKYMFCFMWDQGPDVVLIIWAVSLCVYFGVNLKIVFWYCFSVV